MLALFTTDPLARAFALPARVQAMLDVERALAKVQGQLGLIPAPAAGAIAAACLAERIDLQALERDAVAAGNLAIPLVRQLTAAVAAEAPAAAGYVHWGPTSQDLIDTGCVLQLRGALATIEVDLHALAAAAARLADQHRDTVMAGRTWLQHATPISFGLKAAGWLSALQRDAARLQACKARALALQFGGASGTLAALGDKGPAVASLLAAELDLALPAMPWHTQRDRLVEVGVVLGMLAGTCGKIARDVSLLMQTEVAEAAEPSTPGKGGSSSMPHKRNPVGAALALAAAAQTPGLVANLLAAMPHEHERGLGNWQAEWDTLPQIVQLAGGAVRQMRESVEGLGVDARRMQSNLDATQGLVFAEAVTMALAEHIGKAAAHQCVEAAAREAAHERRALRDVLATVTTVTMHLTPQQLDQLFDPGANLGAAQTFIDRVLAEWRQPGARS